jgi:cyclic pyranopterin phosphate synthase
LPPGAQVQAPSRLPPEPLRDRQGREITYLRLSVTDRCNFRCAYCSPAHWGGTREMMSPAELERLVTIFAGLGARRVRLTGGEPLLRPDLADIASRISRVPGISRVALTTNASRLAPLARALVEAGVSQLNASLDTLDEETFRRISPRGELRAVLDGLEAAAGAGFSSLKLNVVVMQGVNDGEVPALVRFAHQRGYTPRFIELMPFSGGTKVPTAQVLASLVAAGMALQPEPPTDREQDAGPARYYRCATGRVGFIAPLTGNFCGGCNRVRVSARGALRACLGGRSELPLGEKMRAGETDDALVREIRAALWLKEDGHQFGTPGADAQLLTMMGIGG